MCAYMKTEHIKHFITTYSNICFSIGNATNEMIIPQDIAHALSLMCRANGHFEFFYSVGQHSLNCCREAEAQKLSKRIQLGCLLHDASEAYISDITRPVKEYLPEYRAIEDNLQKRIYARFGLFALTESEAESIKEIDDAVLLHEFNALHIGGAWEELPVMLSRFDFTFRDMGEVEKEFLVKLQDLKLDT